MNDYEYYKNELLRLGDSVGDIKQQIERKEAILSKKYYECSKARKDLYFEKKRLASTLDKIDEVKYILANDGF